MSIVTRTGDQGKTGLAGGMRVSKDHPRVQSYGTLDELNAILGMIRLEVDHLAILRIQKELFQLGAELATPASSTQQQKGGLTEAHLEELERELQVMESQLGPLRGFILPGGGSHRSKVAALTHWACTVCRRGEREMVALHQQEPLRPLVLTYVNRLSDYLFILARFFKVQEGGEDENV